MDRQQSIRCRATTASSCSQSRGRGGRWEWGSLRWTGSARHGPTFRRHLAAAIAARGSMAGESEATAYYAAWLDALEALLAERGLIDAAD